MSQTIDSQKAHASADRLREATEAWGRPSPDEVARVLAQRTRAFAQVQDTHQQEDTIDLLVFSVRGRRCAAPLCEVREVITSDQITPLPGAPGLLVAVVNYHGTIVGIADLGSILGLPPAAPDYPSPIVLTEAGSMLWGLLASHVEGIVTTPVDDLAQSPERPGTSGGFVRAVTRDGVAFLDLATVAAAVRARLAPGVSNGGGAS